jgi:hypothetical protein
MLSAVFKLFKGEKEVHGFRQFKSHFRRDYLSLHGQLNVRPYVLRDGISFLQVRATEEIEPCSGMLFETACNSV